MVALSTEYAGTVGIESGGWAAPAGCPVTDVEGEPLGTVASADAECLLVDRGFFRPAWSVPLRAVAGFDGRAVRLAVTEREARRGDWDAAAGRPR
jgi:hypothetical protein